jgi:hypothetical protein
MVCGQHQKVCPGAPNRPVRVALAKAAKVSPAQDALPGTMFDAGTAAPRQQSGCFDDG